MKHNESSGSNTSSNSNTPNMNGEESKVSPLLNKFPEDMDDSAAEDKQMARMAKEVLSMVKLPKVSDEDNCFFKLIAHFSRKHFLIMEVAF